MTSRIKNMIYGKAGRRLLFVAVAAVLTLGASAQRSVNFHGGGGVHGGGLRGGGPRVVYAYPRTSFALGFGYGYGYPWGYPYGAYGPWGYPYPPYYYGYGAMPSELSIHIQDIKNDYNAQIKDVKHDKSLARKERKEKVSQLKQDRDAAVVQARKDYFYQHYQRRNQGNAPQPYRNDEQVQPKGQQPTSSDTTQPEYQERQSSTEGQSSPQGQSSQEQTTPEPASGN